MPDWMIVVLVISGSMFLFLLVRVFLEKNKDGSIPSDGTAADENVENMTDKWLTENNITDDTYESLLMQFFGLDDPVVVESVAINHSDREVTFSIVFPKVEIRKSVVLDFDDVEFNIVDAGEFGGKMMAILYFLENIWSVVPYYEPKVELPIDKMDWDFVAQDIGNIDLDLTKEQYDVLFPTITL